MPSVRFVSKVPNLSICYSVEAKHLVTGLPVWITKSLYFERGAYETDDEVKINAIKKSASFGVYCFEILNGKMVNLDVEETVRETGTPELTTGIRTTEIKPALAKAEKKKPDYIKSEKIEKGKEDNE